MIVKRGEDVRLSGVHARCRVGSAPVACTARRQQIVVVVRQPVIAWVIDLDAVAQHLHDLAVHSSGPPFRAVVLDVTLPLPSSDREFTVRTLLVRRCQQSVALTFVKRGVYLRLAGYVREHLLRSLIAFLNPSVPGGVIGRRKVKVNHVSVTSPASPSASASLRRAPTFCSLGSISSSV